jgi:hypothetical protein
MLKAASVSRIVAKAGDGVRRWQNRAGSAANTMQLFYRFSAQWRNILLFLTLFQRL